MTTSSEPMTIESEVARWLTLCNGPPPADDEYTWDFYSYDIMHIAKTIEDETERAAALTDARSKLNLLNSPPAPFCSKCNDEGWIYWGDNNASRCPECKGVPDGSLLFHRAGVPERFLPYKRFKTYGEDGLKFASKQVAKFVRQYKPGKSLLLIGPVGTGKTHMAVGTIRALCDQKVTCKFWDINEWLDQLRDTYQENRAEGQALLDEVKGVPLLVFDDLGAQRDTEHTVDRLFDVINYRYLNRLSTIVTTNIDEKQISHNFGERLWSRLMEMCLVVNVNSIDHRQRGKVKPKKLFQ